MLLYIICLVVLGLPAMTMEFSVGRAAQASPIPMYQKLEKPGCKWGIFGIASLIGNIALMAFYTVVTGWIIYYFIKFLTGQNADFGFTPDDATLPDGECGVFAGDRSGSICHFKL